MPEEWIVRVQGREYGPVDLDTLREWRRESHLIAENEVRAVGSENWARADSIPELFATDDAPLVPPGLPQIRRRSLGEITTQTFRLYGRNFGTFFSIALIAAIPSCIFKIAFAYVHLPEHGKLRGTSLLASAIAIVSGVIVLVLWPVMLAGIQVATERADAREKVSLGDVLRRAVNFWPRVARLSLVVYASYLLWSVIPLLAIVGLAASQPSILALLFCFVILFLQVYMTTRLFVNFLFWQQSSVIAGHDALESLRESRDLARSRTRPLRLQRPLYRGATIVSVWIVLLLATSVVVEAPFMLFRMQGAMGFDDAINLAQKLANAPAPDLLTLVTYVATSLIHALLRPLLGIAFVLLYFDAKADFTPNEPTARKNS